MQLPEHFLNLTDVPETISITPQFRLRRDDREADCAALEMLCGRESTEGSNPSLSAIFSGTPLQK